MDIQGYYNITRLHISLKALDVVMKIPATDFPCTSRILRLRLLVLGVQANTLWIVSNSSKVAY
jgi:hypothetical protein